MSAQPANQLGVALRGAVGGLLMGLANLVPGISGGTMLLAVGVYPAFISAIADVSRLRFKAASILLLGAVGGAAVLAILLLAGVVKGLVVDHRWVMYSLFIGLTLGGVPLVWRLARPAGASVFGGALIGLAVMVVMAVGLGGGERGAELNTMLLALSGLAGASAMILPGISGGYLLLLLGQYEVILGAIDRLKLGLLGDSAAGTARDLAVVMEALHVVVPVGLGVLIGIVGVSNLLMWLLNRFEKATLGALLGLLLGAVVGLWPFQEGVRPAPGDEVHGSAITAAEIAELDPEDWPVRRFDPTSTQAIAALALIAAGLGATLLIDRLGRDRDAGASPAADRGDAGRAPGGHGRAGSLTGRD